MKFSRRQLVWGGAAAAAALALKPREHSGQHNDYFSRLSQALKEAQLLQPTLVIDYQRLMNNVAQVRKNLLEGPERLPARLVVKSLPSLPLLDELSKALQTHRYMAFNLPMLQTILQHDPQAEVLLGKPMPVAAVRHWLYSENNRAMLPRVQWLVDSGNRLREYADLATTVQKPLRISLEIDVGLHRGGLATQRELKEAIELLHQSPQLQLAGLMGYEAHVGKLPSFIGMQENAWTRAQAFYKTCVQTLRDAGYFPERMTLNSGGSLTYKMHAQATAANDISLGSAFVLPADFDTPLLKGHQAASFIATPVLKVVDSTRIPGLEWLDGIRHTWDPNSQRGFFIHGGHWLADPVSPPGLEPSDLYGHSSNQELWQGSAQTALQPDDHIFFRPRQSEAVFLQFGDIAVYDPVNARIATSWPVFTASA